MELPSWASRLVTAAALAATALAAGCSADEQPPAAVADRPNAYVSASELEGLLERELMLQRSLRRDDRLSSDVDPAPVDGIRFAVVPTSREFDVLFFATPDDAKDAERDIARSETVGGGGAHRRAANVVAVFPDEPERVDSYRVAAATLARLGRACAEPGHRLEPDGERLALHWGAQDSILAPVLRSAAELLTGSDLARLRECPGSPGRACGWLFVDRTKNASRVWCVGALCGNRTRAHRRYSRERDARGRGDPAPT